MSVNGFLWGAFKEDDSLYKDSFTFIGKKIGKTIFNKIVEWFVKRM